MGFSFLVLAIVQSLLPATPWSRLIFAGGYTVGFVITILGRQELYTESTLTAMLPLLVNRNVSTLVALLRFWAVVLAANLVGTSLFAGLLSIHGLFADSVTATLSKVALEAVQGEALPTFLKSILAGWLIALMAWMLPSAKAARLFVILMITYVVAVANLPHVVAGSVEAAYAVFNAGASLHDYCIGFLIPILAGNTLGGVALVAILNHAPLSPELQKDGGSSEPTSRGERQVEGGRASRPAPKPVRAPTVPPARRRRKETS
jgi:formate/nitrite transporter FocA (FNT family)